MSKNINEIPFTELVERTSEIARERADVKPKIRGYVNDVYILEIGRKWDWNFLLVGSTLTMRQRYNTGTVSANTGDTAVTFSSDVSLDSSNTGAKLSINGNNYIYDCVFSQTTSLTIQPPISGNTNVSGASYNLFYPLYSLPENFDRFPKNGGLADYQGNTQKIIQETPFQEWGINYSATPSDAVERVRIFGTDTSGRALLEVNPPPLNAKSYLNNYLQSLSPMRETTAGLIGNIRFLEATTGDFLRIDNLGLSNDSLWYRIIAISGDSGLTLQTAFSATGITSANYTICSAPRMPVKLHAGILYGSVLQCVTDQDDPLYSMYHMKLAEVMSDSKRLYVSRIYNQDIHHLGEEYLYRR